MSYPVLSVETCRATARWALVLTLLTLGVRAFGAEEYSIDYGRAGGGAGLITGADSEVFGSIGQLGDGFIETGDDLIASALQNWRVSWFSAGELANPAAEATRWGSLADPDRDGRLNYLEYALGLSPVSGAGKATAVQAGLTNISGGAFAVLSFRRRQDDPALTYTVEVSTNRVTWQSGVGVTQELPPGALVAPFELANYRVITALDASGPRFIRLRVTGDQAVSSETWMVTPITIQGTGGGAAKLSFFSSRSFQPVIQSGVLGSVAGAVVGDVNAHWADHQFSALNGSTFITFASGRHSDLVDSSSATQTLTLADDVSGWVNPGDAYQIRTHTTLNSLFGDDNRAGLLGGANPSVADNVILHDPATQQTRTYFYSTVTGFTGWYRSDYVAGGKQVIQPGQGVMVKRRAPGNLTFHQVEPIKDGATAALVQLGYNLLGTLRPTTAVTLDQLGLYTTNNVTGVKPGSNPTQADNLIVVNPDGSAVTYFYSNFTGFTGWYRSDFQAAGATTIAPNRVFFLLRRPGNGNFNWLIPGE